jgi:hypothetical protein
VPEPRFGSREATPYPSPPIGMQAAAADEANPETNCRRESRYLDGIRAPSLDDSNSAENVYTLP